MEKIKSKKVFITGGTGTVGSALIRLFHENGYSICFQYYTNESRANELASIFSAEPIKIDFTSHFELPNIDFDIVINNAGINISDSLTHEIKESVWNQNLTTNLTVPFKVCKRYLPMMIDRKWGRIININSIYGLRAVEYNCPYNVSKHGLTGLTRSLAKEYAVHGITSNEICPGAIESDMMNRIAQRVAEEENTTPVQYLDEVASYYPAKRLVRPNEVCAVAIFLASEEASYINGTSIPVDGGLIC